MSLQLVTDSLNHQFFKSGQKRQNVSLCGIPGEGKTILCSTIIEHMIKIRNSTRSDLYAYFDFDFNEKRTVVSMLSSIIAQLCIQKNAVPVELLNRILIHRNILQVYWKD